MKAKSIDQSNDIDFKDKDPLATKFQINSITLKNRLVKSATKESMVDEKGIIKQNYFDYYEKLSSGGIALIITGHMHVNEEGWDYKGMASADNDDQIPLLKKVADIVHNNGAAIFAQLNHAGFKVISGKRKDRGIVAPSKTKKAKKLSLSEIEKIIDDFGKSALRVKKGGFDGIQLHGAHAYLISQFLSKRLNRRNDKYGGSLKNRQRFLLEVYNCIRERVGDSFPITIKLDSYLYSYASIPPFIPLININESLDTAKQLEEVGIDAIEVSCGFNANRGALPIKDSVKAVYIYEEKPFQAAVLSHLLTPIDLIINHNNWFKAHHNINHIALFKKQLNVPILAGSCFRSPGYMRYVIESNKADMICMARPLIHDPYFPNKILSGSNEQSGCINCNLCLTLLPLGNPLRCYQGIPPR